MVLKIPRIEHRVERRSRTTFIDDVVDRYASLALFIPLANRLPPSDACIMSSDTVESQERKRNSSSLVGPVAAFIFAKNALELPEISCSVTTTEDISL